MIQNQGHYFIKGITGRLWKVMDGILKRESKRMCACVGLGGEKRRQERGEVATEQICKHHTLLTTYTHSTHNLGGAWPPTRSSSSVICGSIDEACEDVYSHNGRGGR